MYGYSYRCRTLISTFAGVAVAQIHRKIVCKVKLPATLVSFLNYKTASRCVYLVTFTLELLTLTLNWRCARCMGNL